MIAKILWQSEFPVYLLADYAGWTENTVRKIIKVNDIETYKKQGTVFVSRDETLRLMVLSEKIRVKIIERYLHK